MFFILSKFFSFLVQPYSWIIILILVAYFTKRQILKKWTFRLAIYGMLFFTNSVIFLEFARMWESKGIKYSEIENYDVAIVLGGMAEYDNNLERLSLRRGGDRLWQALHLYGEKRVKKIMIVGANGNLLDESLQEAAQFKAALIQMGVPASDIITEEKSKNTYENAVEAKKVLDDYPSLKKVLLVTSATHMKRSIACFEKAGFENIGYFSTDHFTGEIRGYKLDQYFIPNASNFTGWGVLIHEWIGYTTYWVKGYI